MTAELPKPRVITTADTYAEDCAGHVDALVKLKDAYWETHNGFSEMIQKARLAERAALVEICKIDDAIDKLRGEQ